jgi:hypothetical protein
LLKTLLLESFNKEFTFFGGEGSEVLGNIIDVFESGKLSRFGTFRFLAKFLLWFWAFSREMSDFSAVEAGTLVRASDTEV